MVIHLIEIIGRVHQMWKLISLNNEESKLDVLIHSYLNMLLHLLLAAVACFCGAYTVMLMLQLLPSAASAIYSMLQLLQLHQQHT